MPEGNDTRSQEGSIRFISRRGPGMSGGLTAIIVGSYCFLGSLWRRRAKCPTVGSYSPVKASFYTISALFLSPYVRAQSSSPSLPLTYTYVCDVSPPMLLLFLLLSLLHSLLALPASFVSIDSSGALPYIATKTNHLLPKSRSYRPRRPTPPTFAVVFITERSGFRVYGNGERRRCRVGNDRTAGERRRCPAS